MKVLDDQLERGKLVIWHIRCHQIHHVEVVKSKQNDENCEGTFYRFHFRCFSEERRAPTEMIRKLQSQKRIRQVIEVNESKIYNSSLFDFSLAFFTKLSFLPIQSFELSWSPVSHFPFLIHFDEFIRSECVSSHHSGSESENQHAALNDCRNQVNWNESEDVNFHQNERISISLTSHSKMFQEDSDVTWKTVLVTSQSHVVELAKVPEDEAELVQEITQASNQKPRLWLERADNQEDGRRQKTKNMESGQQSMLMRLPVVVLIQVNRGEGAVHLVELEKRVEYQTTHNYLVLRQHFVASERISLSYWFPQRPSKASSSSKNWF